MVSTKTITTQVLEVLQCHPGCEFDVLVKECSEFTWNQLFYEVDRLNQLGQLRLTSVGGGHYFIRLPSIVEAINPTQLLIDTQEVERTIASSPEIEPKSVEPAG